MTVLLPVGVATSVVIGRVLGPAGKGEYTLATLIGSLLLTVLNFGIQASVSYFMAREEAPQGSWVKTAMVLGGILGTAGIVLAWALDRTGWCAHVFGVPRLTRAMWFVVLTLPVQFWGLLLQFVVLTQGHTVLFAAAPALSQFIGCLLVGVFVLLGSLTPLTATTALILPQALMVGAMLLYTQSQVDWWHAPLLAGRVWKSLTKYSAASYGANTIQFLTQRVDVLLVSAFLGLRAVGLYAVAYGIAELLLLLPQRVGCLYVPRIAGEAVPGGKAEELRVSTSLVFVGTVMAAAILSLIAPLGVRIFYGPPFAPSVGPFFLLLPGLCAMAASSIQAAYLAGIGRVNTNARIAGVGLGLNVLLNLVFIPRYGILGAAAVSSLTYCTQALLLIAAVSRVTEAPPLAMLTSAPPAIFFGLLKRAFRREGAGV